MDKKVVVTGMGVVTPVGNNVADFWKNLLDGVCGIDFIKAFPTDDLPVKIAGEVKDFNPAEHGIEPAFARKQDKFTVYAVAAANEAMKQAGLDSKEGGNIDPFMISNIAAGNVAIRNNACGPSLDIVTACATSTHAIGEAYRAIKHGYADAIIAGGSEAATIPLGIAGFANAKALSKAEDPKYASLPFNLNRGGFVMAEGAGMLVLEEYEHAKARGAQIFAEVVGYGNTNDAHHVTAPRPDGVTQAKAIEEALKEAGFDGEKDTLYINAHGTGTHLNDASETAAFKLAMGEENARKAHISSTKSMTGHMLGAAGAVEAIASILALKNGIVPPTINLDTPDPECDLNYTPNKPEKVDLTIAISDSLGFGGHNGCVAFRKAE